MYSINELGQEIAGCIDTAIANGQKIHPKWVTQQILCNHPDIEGEDADFYKVVGKDSVYDHVRRRINRFKLAPENELEVDSQLTLPGFKRVQKAYLTEIEGVPIAIPVDRLSSPQRLAKVRELRLMGAGCYAHADELERYDRDHPNPDPETIAA